MTTDSRLNYPVYRSKADSFEPKASYCPSVPLYIYRELVKELQVTQGQVERLELENQALIRQNQKLQENIEQVLTSAQQLPKIIDIINQDNNIILKRDLGQKKINSSVTQSGNSNKIYRCSSSQAQSYRIDIPPQSGAQLPGEPHEFPTNHSQFSQLDSERATKNQLGTPINGWILGIGIFLIIVMSCTGAYLVVNMKLNPNSR